MGVVGKQASGDRCQHESDEPGESARTTGIKLLPEHGTLAQRGTMPEPAAASSDGQLNLSHALDFLRSAVEFTTLVRLFLRKERAHFARLRPRNPGGEKSVATARLQQ